MNTTSLLQRSSLQQFLPGCALAVLVAVPAQAAPILPAEPPPGVGQSNNQVAELVVKPGDKTNSAYGISKAGKVVGAPVSSANNSGKTQGFVDSKGQVSAQKGVDKPANETGNTGKVDSGDDKAINNKGAVVGVKTGLADGQALGRKEGATNDLGTLGGAPTGAMSLSDSGQVVGSPFTTAGSSIRPSLSTKGGTQDPSLSPSATGASASATNSASAAVGAPQNGASNTLGSPNSAAAANSNSGQMVGSSSSAAATSMSPSLSTKGGTQDPSLSPSATGASASATNSASAAVGAPQNGTSGTLSSPNSAATATSNSGPVVGSPSTTAATSMSPFLYTKGGTQDPSLLQNATSAPASLLPNATGAPASAASNSGAAVGVPLSGSSRALDPRNGQLTDPSTLSSPNSTATAMSNSGQIAGWSNLDSQSLARAAMFWSSASAPVDPNSLMPPNTSWTLNQATSTNDSGQTAGSVPFEESPHAFLVLPTPAPEPSALLLFGAVALCTLKRKR